MGRKRSVYDDVELEEVVLLDGRRKRSKDKRRRQYEKISPADDEHCWPEQRKPTTRLHCSIGNTSEQDRRYIDDSSKRFSCCRNRSNSSREKRSCVGVSLTAICLFLGVAISSVSFYSFVLHHDIRLGDVEYSGKRLLGKLTKFAAEVKNQQFYRHIADHTGHYHRAEATRSMAIASGLDTRNNLENTREKTREFIAGGIIDPLTASIIDHHPKGPSSLRIPQFTNKMNNLYDERGHRKDGYQLRHDRPSKFLEKGALAAGSAGAAAGAAFVVETAGEIALIAYLASHASNLNLKLMAVYFGGDDFENDCKRREQLLPGVPFRPCKEYRTTHYNQNLRATNKLWKWLDDRERKDQAAREAAMEKNGEKTTSSTNEGSSSNGITSKEWVTKALTPPREQVPFPSSRHLARKELLKLLLIARKLSILSELLVIITDDSARKTGKNNGAKTPKDRTQTTKNEPPKPKDEPRNGANISIGETISEKLCGWWKRYVIGGKPERDVPDEMKLRQMMTNLSLENVKNSVEGLSGYDASACLAGQLQSNGTPPEVAELEEAFVNVKGYVETMFSRGDMIVKGGTNANLAECEVFDAEKMAAEVAKAVPNSKDDSASDRATTIAAENEIEVVQKDMCEILKEVLSNEEKILIPFLDSSVLMLANKVRQGQAPHLQEMRTLTRRDDLDDLFTIAKFRLSQKPNEEDQYRSGIENVIDLKEHVMDGIMGQFHDHINNHNYLDGAYTQNGWKPIPEETMQEKIKSIEEMKSKEEQQKPKAENEVEGNDDNKAKKGDKTKDDFDDMKDNEQPEETDAKPTSFIDAQSTSLIDAAPTSLIDAKPTPFNRRETPITQSKENKEGTVKIRKRVRVIFSDAGSTVESIEMLLLLREMLVTRTIDFAYIFITGAACNDHAKLAIDLLGQDNLINYRFRVVYVPFDRCDKEDSFLQLQEIGVGYDKAAPLLCTETSSFRTLIGDHTGVGKFKEEDSTSKAFRLVDHDGEYYLWESEQDVDKIQNGEIDETETLDGIMVKDERPPQKKHESKSAKSSMLELDGSPDSKSSPRDDSEAENTKKDLDKTEQEDEPDAATDSAAKEEQDAQTKTGDTKQEDEAKTAGADQKTKLEKKEADDAKKLKGKDSASEKETKQADEKTQQTWSSAFETDDEENEEKWETIEAEVEKPEAEEKGEQHLKQEQQLREVSEAIDSSGKLRPPQKKEDVLAFGALPINDETLSKSCQSPDIDAVTQQAMLSDFIGTMSVVFRLDVENDDAEGGNGGGGSCGRDCGSSTIELASKEDNSSFIQLAPSEIVGKEENPHGFIKIPSREKKQSGVINGDTKVTNGFIEKVSAKEVFAHTAGEDAALHEGPTSADAQEDVKHARESKQKEKENHPTTGAKKKNHSKVGIDVEIAVLSETTGVAEFLDGLMAYV